MSLKTVDRLQPNRERSTCPPVACQGSAHVDDAVIGRVPDDRGLGDPIGGEGQRAWRVDFIVPTVGDDAGADLSTKVIVFAHETT